jgi:hypothetical protein
VLFLQQGIFGHEGLDSGYEVGFLFFGRESPSRRGLEVVGLFVARGGFEEGHLGNLHH